MVELFELMRLLRIALDAPENSPHRSYALAEFDKYYQMMNIQNMLDNLQDEEHDGRQD